MDDNRLCLIHHSHHGHPSKAEKRLSIHILAYWRSRLDNHTLTHRQEYYNFLKFNATSQKAHDNRKKA